VLSEWYGGEPQDAVIQAWNSPYFFVGHDLAARCEE
jgi:hypothetical protein